MTNMAKTKNSKTPEKVTRPFMTGGVTDESTVKNAFVFFGILIVTFFIMFIACATTSFGNVILRSALNIVVIALIVVVFFNNGTQKGTDAVARGEILFQKNENGKPFTPAEKKLCYHPAKGFVTGLLGTIPFLVLAVILALKTQIQMTGPGSLPSWMQAYTKRSDIGDALITYTQPEGMSFVDFVRAVVRICILPFINIAGSSNKAAILVLERISPLILMIPSAAYGIGYMKGKTVRTRIHTAISESNRKRIRKEKRKAAQRRNARPSQPEQLN